MLLAMACVLASYDLNRRAPPVRDKGLYIMFYNVENLFDTLDSDLDDDEFLPSSPRRWNSYKYYRKLHNIFKVIALCSDEMRAPDIIGLCEVENAVVLRDLCEKTYLRRENYDFIISDGRDQRGIKTALLFRQDKLGLISSESWDPVDAEGKYMATRAVLYGRFQFMDDSLDIMVAHWPSRRGGVMASEAQRKAVAAFTREKADSLGAGRKLIIMGDLNDEPNSESVSQTLGAAAYTHGNAGLVNTASENNDARGTYKYQGLWYSFDQVILSSSLFRADSGLNYAGESFRIVYEDALLTEDLTYKGFRPFSTWWGYNYTGGFSDHLPVRLWLDYR
ncbi:MAG: endonuclease/exonuclease/phosphatase family protein [Bacteroidales bacterium]|nr:endonuclease/exonuclease/phosphatase family protein [Bacteroidales bacterium]